MSKALRELAERHPAPSHPDPLAPVVPAVVDLHRERAVVRSDQQDWRRDMEWRRWEHEQRVWQLERLDRERRWEADLTRRRQADRRRRDLLARADAIENAPIPPSEIAFSAAAGASGLPMAVLPLVREMDGRALISLAAIGGALGVLVGMGAARHSRARRADTLRARAFQMAPD